MTRLSVNINKFATLRNSRGGNNPDVQKAAVDCEKFGAQGVTVHPRPDERHIKYQDVPLIKKLISTELNIEGYPCDTFLSLIENVIPAQVTLVPDSPGTLTSNAGWDTKQHKSFLSDVVARIQALGIRTSVFIETDIDLISYAAETKTNRIELYTEPYARLFHQDKRKAVEPYVYCAKHAHSVGLEINAGHDLNLDNLKYFKEKVPFLDEVSIGHALVCDALYFGLENTIKLYLKALQD